MGHAYEFLHSFPVSNHWDAMGETHGPPLPQYGSQGGQHTIAYHKDLHGWIPASRIYNAAPASRATITLDRSELPPAGANYLMAKIPIGRSYQHFYTVEVRRKVGYDSNLPGEGVIICDVLKGRLEPAHVVDGDNNGDPNDAGAIWNAGETFTDAANGVQITVVSETATSATVTITDLPLDTTLTVDQRPFTTLAGVAGVSGSADGSGPNARFIMPSGIAADAAGNLFVADLSNKSIRKVTPAGVVTTFAGVSGPKNTPCFPGGLGDATFVDGTGAAATFCGPSGIAITAAGVLYVTDRCAIRRITPAAVVTTVAGSLTCGSADGAGTAASFSFPGGIAVDDAGVVYVADSLSHTIRKILPGGAVSTLAGTAGVAGSVDGAGAAARFNSPTAVAVDSTGRVYVGDQNSGTIRSLTPAGVVTTLAGSANQKVPIDGPAGTARFSRPQAIAIDRSSGVLYVTDSARVRQVEPSGTVTTIAGSGSGSADGVGTAARFSVPAGIAVAPGGTLYVADTGNFTIRAAIDMRVTASPALLRFNVARAGASGAILGITPAQNVTVRSGGSSVAPAWTVTADQPWVQVANGPATGAGTFNVSIVNPAEALAGATTLISTITLTSSNPTVSLAIAVVLSVQPVSTPPFGTFDTPTGDQTVLAGSIAVTGWTLDNIGVKRVELWRDLQSGETTPPFTSTPTDPRNGKVFISNATFVEGARPDVEALYQANPFANRAGWGYLLLTWGLWNQGNGTYTLYAFAFDQEDNVATIGSKSIVVSNNTAAKPFGSIDTPAIGGDPGTAPNFGWGLTPKVNGVATCRIPSSGVQVSIDSGPLQPVAYGDARPDIAGAFTGFSNSDAAGGHFIVDWSALTRGTHTIGWLITDDCNRADGVGSRFFNVAAGSNLLAVPREPEGPAAQRVPGANRWALRESDAAITVARGYGELPLVVDPGLAGSRTVEVKLGERIEVRLPHGYDTAYQLGPGGQIRALPIGAMWDGDNGIFSWQPAPGFLGRHRMVFTDGTERINVRVVVVP